MQNLPAFPVPLELTFQSSWHFRFQAVAKVFLLLWKTNHILAFTVLLTFSQGTNNSSKGGHWATQRMPPPLLFKGYCQGQHYCSIVLRVRVRVKMLISPSPLGLGLGLKTFLLNVQEENGGIAQSAERSLCKREVQRSKLCASKKFFYQLYQDLNLESPDPQSGALSIQPQSLY